jgi:hypothetical protein
MKLPEYAAHPSQMSIKEEVSTLILMCNKQHIKYFSISIQYHYIAETVYGHPHTINDDIHKVTIEYNFGGRAELFTNCNLRNLWYIYIFLISLQKISCTERSRNIDWLRTGLLRCWSWCPGRVKNFSLLHVVWTTSETHLSLLSSGYQ